MEYKVGKYTITLKNAHTFAMPDEPKYIEVLARREEVHDIYVSYVYVDLFKTGYLKLDARNYPSDQTDRVEYEAYVSRKSSPQPLTKASVSGLETILKWLENNQN